MIRDTVGLEGWEERSEHPQAEQMLLEKLLQAPMAMGVIAKVLGILGRPEMRKQICSELGEKVLARLANNA